MTNIKFRLRIKRDGVVETHYKTLDNLIDGWFNTIQYKSSLEILSKDQYTGAKDKNGKEIYEGDVVRFVSWEREWDTIEIELVEPIEFKEGAFDPIPKRCKCEDGYYSYGYKNFEVIGSIYENPELLE